MHDDELAARFQRDFEVVRIEYFRAAVVLRRQTNPAGPLFHNTLIDIGIQLVRADTFREPRPSR